VIIPHIQSTTSGGPGPAAPPKRGGSLAKGLLRALRPKQWLKSVLVLAAPGAAGDLTRLHPLLVSLGAAGIFCIVASGVYLLNDSFDVEADRRHPTKCRRPIAAGIVPVRLAQVLGGILMAGGIGLAWVLAGKDLSVVMGVYVAINLAYSTWLKHEAVIDLAAVSSGFILRAIAGGVAIGITLSPWFVIVASFGSLFMVAGKRTAEQTTLGDARASHRPTLAAYSPQFLAYVRTLAAAVAITAYCLWAFAKAIPAGHDAIWFKLSIAPFVMAILRYALLIDQGLGGAPEEVVLGDRILQVLGLALVALFALGIYG
jgi:decaprenyl-phosphate phosphoribosyltransferase